MKNNKINEFPHLSFDIAPKAFSIFRSWSNIVKQKYPGWEPLVDNEGEIVNAVKMQMLDGLWAIANGDPAQKNLTDWCIGYLIGSCISGLTIFWSVKYLEKPLIYKNALWLKSIVLYLDVDKDTLKRINRLYLALMERNFPFQEEDNNVSAENFETHHIIPDAKVEEHWKENKEFLEEMIYEKTLKLITKHEFPEVPDIQDFFEYWELEEIILKNPYYK